MNSIPIGPSTCPLFLLSIPVFLCFHLFVFFIILFVFVFWEGRGVNLLSSECFWLIFSDLGYFFQLFLKIFGIIYGWYRVCFGSSRVCFGNSRVWFGNSRVILDIFWTIFSDSGEKVAQLAGSFFSNPFFEIIRFFVEKNRFLKLYVFFCWTKSTVFEGHRNSFVSFFLFMCFCLTPFSDLYFCMLFFVEIYI